MAETYFRRIIRIKATDSPNVRRWLRYREAGIKPVVDDCELVPGVLGGMEYEVRRATWDKVRATIGLDAQFYEGGELLLFPPDWLNLASSYSRVLKCQSAPAEGIGCDPGEGIACTSFAAVNRWGLKDLLSRPTPNTAVIKGELIAFARKHGLEKHPDKWVIDRGGGGKQIEDELRTMGYVGVRSVGFGETPHLETKRGLHSVEKRIDTEEDRYAYVSLRAQLYHELSQCVDPSSWLSGFPAVMQQGIPGLETLPSGYAALRPVPGETDEDYARRRNRLETAGQHSTVGFAIPGEGELYTKLRQQLAVFPKDTNEEGRYRLPPKHKRDKEDKRVTLVDMIGYSPDEADSVVLALYAMCHKKRIGKVGAAGR